MNKTFYVGEYKEDTQNEYSVHRGWLVGGFMSAAPRKNNDVEIKYWEYSAGETVKTYLKTSSTVECTFILKGRTKCLIDGNEIILKAGDYIVIQPGTPNNTVSEILDDTIGLTIKSPSDPSAKKIL